MAVPGLALVRLIPAVVAPLALVSPVVAVDVAVAHLILVDVVGTPAIVLVGVVLAVGRLAVAALRRRDALARSGALELVVPALLVGVDLGAVGIKTQYKTSQSQRRGSCDKMCLTVSPYGIRIGRSVSEVKPVIVDLDVRVRQLPHALGGQGAYLVGPIHAVHTLVASLGLCGKEDG